MKNSKLIFLFALLSSCLRLDSNLYNNGEKITVYKLDFFNGEKECADVPSTYNIHDSLIHIFSLQSDDAGSKANIYAIYVGEISRIATDTVILYCHGNKNHMDYYWNREKLLANVGGKNRFGVLMMDYRGFGLSEGTPTESGMNTDVIACEQWLKDNGLTSDRLIMYGYSLGSSPATKLTAEQTVLTPSKLILESPFASSDVLVQDATKIAVPASYFTNLEINNAEEIKNVHQPFCWLHGVDDDFLSIKTNGELVFANHPGPIKIPYRIDGAGHNNVPTIMSYEKYISALEKFIVKGE
ncbi:hypothetical protein LBMAG27_25300 [Bacteroidota bacterium]|nr:hypothetical protein LBMAG27_25300 [Bacteroidota bacterium]